MFLAPFIFKALIIPLFWTLRKKQLGGDYYQKLIKSGKPYIVTFWHYSIFCAVISSGTFPAVAMASASRDGEFIVRILNDIGIETVRGSRNRGGIGALKGLLKGVKRGLCPVLVADGSQGPARIAQGGSILMASLTGIPVIPVAWSFKHYKVFRSWDRTVLPLPFSPMVELIGEPLQVPPKLDAEGLEEYRKKLEDRLNDLYKNAWGMFDITDHAKG